MGRINSDAERFIADLEGLLHAAREAAAATLLSEVGTEPVEQSGPPVTLYSCTAASRNESLRVVVQLLGRQALYEGAAERADWTESPVRVAARAALAALTEWNPRLVLGIGDVVELETRQGLAVVVTVIVREEGGAPSETRLVGSAWLDGGGAAAGARAILQAFSEWDVKGTAPESPSAL